MAELKLKTFTEDFLSRFVGGNKGHDVTYCKHAINGTCNILKMNCTICPHAISDHIQIARPNAVKGYKSVGVVGSRRTTTKPDEPVRIFLTTNLESNNSNPHGKKDRVFVSHQAFTNGKIHCGRPKTNNIGK